MGVSVIDQHKVVHAVKQKEKNGFHRNLKSVICIGLQLLSLNTSK